MPRRLSRFAVAVTVALVLPACAGAAGEQAETPAPCGPVQHPPVQGGEHLIGDAKPPVPYSSTPPTSGWHASGAFDIAVQPPDEPLTEPQQVSVLEAGGVVVTYGDLPDADRRALEDLVGQHFPRRAAVSSYPKLDAGQVAMTAWGTLQVCERLDLDMVAAFITTHASESPSTPGAHAKS